MGSITYIATLNHVNTSSGRGAAVTRPWRTPCATHITQPLRIAIDSTDLCGMDSLPEQKREVNRLKALSVRFFAANPILSSEGT